VDYVAEQARAGGRTSVAIGYDVQFYNWVLFARHADGVSKVGDDYDMLLWRRHGITNTDTRCEGVSPDDDFRIVEHQSNQAWRQTLFDLSSYPRMEVIHETPNYTVLRKHME